MRITGEALQDRSLREPTAAREAEIPKVVGAIVEQAERLEKAVEALSARVAAVSVPRPDMPKDGNVRETGVSTPLGSELRKLAERLSLATALLVGTTDAIEL